MKFLLAVVFAPALCLGAIWPENIGAWKRTATTQASLSDRPIWDEYGLKESEGARYEKEGESFTVTGYRLQDTTGAMSAFDWQRPAKSTVSQLAPLAVNTGDGLLVVHGNYLLSFSGHTPEAAELKTLFDGLRNVDTTVLPILPANLPAQDRVANSERYIIGPASLTKFVPAIPPSVAAFTTDRRANWEFSQSEGRYGDGDFQLSDSADCHAKESSSGNTRWQCVKRSGPRGGGGIPAGPGCCRTAAFTGEISGVGNPGPMGPQPQRQHRQPGHKCVHSHRDTARAFHRVRFGIWRLAGFPAARNSR
jgi:hypothetical protein